MTDTNSTIIDIQCVKKSFRKHRVQELLVLDEVNFAMRSGEIIALLGQKVPINEII